MTTIQQALHIFRKDARHLRFELAASGLLLVILLLTSVQSWESVQESGVRAYIYRLGPLMMLILLSWALLIARVIQTEALPGDRHFWLTRPYNRGSLVLAKLLFAVAFINLPLLVVQAAIVAMNGLPLSANLGGLFSNQMVLSTVLLLPVAAVAALTRNLAQFIPAMLLTVAVIAIPIQARRGYGDLEWVASTLGGVLVVAIAGVVLWRQYRLRRSVHTAAVGMAATLVAVIIYAAFPQSAAFAIQSQLNGGPDGAFALRLGEPGPRAEEPAVPNRFQQLVAFPIIVEGANPADLRIQSAELTFRTLSGVRRRIWAHVDVVDQRLQYMVSLDRAFFDAAKDAPVTLQAELYLTQYGNARTADAPLDGTPVYVSGLGQCGVVANYNRRRFVCRSAFRNPLPFQSDQVKPWRGYDPLRDSWVGPRLPFVVHPMSYRTYEFVTNNELAPASPLQPMRLLVRDPIAYFRHTMEATNVRLGDFAIRTDGQR